MNNEVIDRVHILDWCRKSAFGITFIWQYITEIVDEANDEPVQALEYYDYDYEPYDDETDNYNSDDDPQYDYYPRTVITGVKKMRHIRNRKTIFITTYKPYKRKKLEQPIEISDNSSDEEDTNLEDEAYTNEEKYSKQSKYDNG